MFPFPLPNELQSADTTDVSRIEVGLLQRDWKAKYAIRDDTLVQKLCGSLKNILGDTVLTADSGNSPLESFSPRLQSDLYGEIEEWFTNPSEAHSRYLLDKGVFPAAHACLALFGRYRFKLDKENAVEGGRSKVDYVVMVDNDRKGLCEAKSPSVMKKLGNLLPLHGIELTWVPGQSLIPKILAKAALYLGLRQLEWLFLTSHNYWIVCRLVRDDSRPFLAYSPKISIEDSSEPFRAFLGAILSVIKDISVEPSAFGVDMRLDTIIDDKDEGPTYEADIDDNSGAYPGKGGTTDPPMTCCRVSLGSSGSGLMITSSSPNSPESFQVWIHVHALSNNTLPLPDSDRNGEQRLWLTRFLGSGSTGNVWQCRFDNGDKPFAAKIVELLSFSDTDS